MIYIVQQVKCPYCKEQDTKENLVQVGKRYWHQECIEAKENEKSELDQIKERDKQERKELIEYVCQLFNIKAPTGLILKQMKQYHEEFDYRYKAIQLALEYFFVVQDKPINGKVTLGIVPYVMEDAKKFYTNLASVGQQEIEEVQQTKVVIKSPQRKVDRKKKLINMDDL